MQVLLKLLKLEKAGFILKCFKMIFNGIKKDYRKMLIKNLIITYEC